MDTSFDGDALDTTDFNAGADSARSIALNGDGTIYAGGTSGSDFALVHYYASPLTAPTGLSAAGNSSVSSNLTWSDNSLSETDFLIERSEDATFATESTFYAGAPDTTAVSDEDVPDGTLEYYRVSAINPANASAPSSAASYLTQPLGPGDLFLDTPADAEDQRVLTWDTPSDSVHREVILDRASDPNFTTNLTSTIMADGATNYTDTVNIGDIWFYRARTVASAVDSITSTTVTKYSDYAIATDLTVDSANRSPDPVAPISVVGADLKVGTSSDYALESDVNSEYGTRLVVLAGTSVNFSAAGVGLAGSKSEKESWFGKLKGKGDAGGERNITLSQVTWDFFQDGTSTPYQTLPGYNSAAIFDSTGNYHVKLSIVSGGNTAITPTTLDIRVTANPIISASRKIYVSSTGSTSNTGLSSGSPIPWQSLQGVLDAQATATGHSGDIQVLFNRGNVITMADASGGFKALTLRGYSNIWFDAYGSGADPVLSFPNKASASAATATPFVFSTSNKFIEFRNLQLHGQISATLQTGVGTGFDVKGSHIVVSNVTLDQMWRGMQAQGGMQGLLVNNLHTVFLGGTKYSNTGTYLLYETENKSGQLNDNFVILNCNTGDAYVKDHNIRTNGDHILIYNCNVKNVVDTSDGIPKFSTGGDFVSGTDPKGATLRANIGEFVWWSSNTAKGGQIYLGPFKGQGGSLKYVVVEKTKVISDPSENTYALGLPRFVIGQDASSGAISYVVIRNNYLDSALSRSASGYSANDKGGSGGGILDKANHSYVVHNTVTVKLGVPFAFQFFGNSTNKSEFSGNLVPALNSATIVVDIQNASNLSFLKDPNFDAPSSTDPGHHVYHRQGNAWPSAAKFNWQGASGKTVSDWNALASGYTDGSLASDVGLDTSYKPISGPTLKFVTLIDYVWDDINNVARTATTRIAGAAE